MNILVTGGAGYIGSITTQLLLKKGHAVVVVDNLSQGHKEIVPAEAQLVVADLKNAIELEQKLDEASQGKTFDAVIHFAASALAGESMQNPRKYFENNLLGGLNLLEYMVKKNIPHIVFSSSCAIYGTPATVPVTEDAPKAPESPYGESKLMFEKMLFWYDKVFGIKSVCLRYFNASGASMDGKLGENHDPETHVIPNAIAAALNGTEFSLFGNTYPTKDGSCVRDYIHVEDLADAHHRALLYLQEHKQSNAFNVGTGHGYSNLEVIEMVKKVSGRDLNVKIMPPRPGDPPIVFADTQKVQRELGFSPQFSDLETIVKSAYEWHVREK